VTTCKPEVGEVGRVTELYGLATGREVSYYDTSYHFCLCHTRSGELIQLAAVQDFAGCPVTSSAHAFVPWRPWRPMPAFSPTQAA
jgi:hypothetical protein